MFLRLRHNISDAGPGKDIDGITGVITQFLSQAGDINLKEVRRSQIGFSPHLVEELIWGYYPAGVLGDIGQ